MNRLLEISSQLEKNKNEVIKLKDEQEKIKLESSEDSEKLNTAQKELKDHELQVTQLKSRIQKLIFEKERRKEKFYSSNSKMKILEQKEHELLIKINDISQEKILESQRKRKSSTPKNGSFDQQEFKGKKDLPLSPDWVILKSHSQDKGRSYFFNKVTGTSQWSDPRNESSSSLSSFQSQNRTTLKPPPISTSVLGSGEVLSNVSNYGKGTPQRIIKSITQNNFVVGARKRKSTEEPVQSNKYKK